MDRKGGGGGDKKSSKSHGKEGKHGSSESKRGRNNSKDKSKNGKSSHQHQAPSKHPSHSFIGWDSSSSKPRSHDELKWIGSDQAVAGDTKKNSSFRVITWNILADEYSFAHFYDHLDDPGRTLAWGKRSKMIYSALRELDPDILCLQEVDSFTGVSLYLKSLGMTGCFQKRTGHKVDGVAIFWKTSRFQQVGEKAILSFSEHMGRDGEDRVALRVCLQVLDEKGVPSLHHPFVCVCTTHLDYKRPQSQLQMATWFSAFVEQGRKECPRGQGAVLACGDFNCNFDSAPVRTFCAALPHMQSVWPTRCPSGAAVITSHSIHADHIDHLFYDDRRMTLRAIVAPLMTDARLPHETFPSDHYPVGAVLEFVHDKEDYGKDWIQDEDGDQSNGNNNNNE